MEGQGRGGGMVYALLSPSSFICFDPLSLGIKVKVRFLYTVFPLIRTIVRDPACIRDPASIRTTWFTDEHDII